MKEGRTNLVPRLQQDAYVHALAAAQPGVSIHRPRYGSKHVDQFLCLYAGCETSFSTGELLEQHGGAHALSHTSRLARNDLAVNIAGNNDFAIASKFDPHTLPFHSAVGSPEGHVRSLSAYPGLPYSVGDHLIANGYNNNSYAPCAPTTTRAQGPPATDLPNKHIAAPFDWSDPSCSVEDPVSPTRPRDFCKGPLDLVNPAFAEWWNQQPPAAHWHHPDLSGFIEHPLATNATSTGNNALPTGPDIYPNKQAAAESPSLIPTSKSPLVPFDIGPPVPLRPMCTECHGSFGRQADLLRHARIHKAGSKVFRCAVAGCGYSNYRKDKLDEHVGRRHRVVGAA